MINLRFRVKNNIIRMNTLLLLLLTLFSILNSNCKKSKEKEEAVLFKAHSVTVLDDKVVETSGLIYFDNSFWTINDSGNENILYRIDPKSGLVIGEISINNSTNIDWEEISQDQEYIYVADIGDNSRVRDEKQIYRLKKSEVLKVKTGGSMDCEVIRFRYPEIESKKISYDAEALISMNGVLHLFTKDLFESRHFTIPAQPGQTTATFIESYASNGQVTGAAIGPSTNSIIMVGYFGFGDRLFWEVKDFTKTSVMGTAAQPLSLGSVTETGQVEAVCFGADGKVFFTNENYGSVKQQLWTIPYPVK
jgi:hypothetical protein